MLQQPHRSHWHDPAKIKWNRHDPWARREAWRNHEMFSTRHQLRHALPGFWWGVGAFLIYLAYEKLTTDNTIGHKPHVETKE